MTTHERIQKGIEIRDKVFGGNQYSQLALIMEGVKAIRILIDENSSQEDITWAEEKMSELDSIYDTIQELRNS